MIASTTPRKEVRRYGVPELRSFQRIHYISSLSTEKNEVQQPNNTNCLGRVKVQKSHIFPLGSKADRTMNHQTESDSVLPKEPSFLSPSSAQFKLSPTFGKIQSDVRIQDADSMHHRPDLQSINGIGRIHRQPNINPSPPLFASRPESWNSWSATGTESWRRHFRQPIKIVSSDGSFIDVLTDLRRSTPETIAATYNHQARYSHGTSLSQMGQPRAEMIHLYKEEIRKHQWRRIELNRELRRSSDPGKQIVSEPIQRTNEGKEIQSDDKNRQHRHVHRTIVQLENDGNHSRWACQVPFNDRINGGFQHKRGHMETSRTGMVTLKQPPTTGISHQGREQARDLNKRSVSPSRNQISDMGQRPHTSSISFKKSKGFDKLNLLCTATLEMGELYDNPTGCSCPKSKCIALYCDCFKAGRRCNPNKCKCIDCKNTVEESGVGGARTKAIRSILGRLR